MAVQLRDTLFGFLIRRLTRNSVFQYPEEQNIGACLKIQHDGATNSSGHDNEPANETLQDQAETAKSEKLTEERHNNKHLVDWYSPDDPEVCHCHAPYVPNLLIPS